MTKESLPPLLWGNVLSDDVIYIIICDSESSFNKTISTVAAIKAVLHLGSLWKNNRVNTKIHKGFGANIWY